jgi:hypothetical protein
MKGNKMQENMKKFTTPGRVKEVNASIIAPQNAGLRLILNTVGQDGKFDSKLDVILTKQWKNVRLDAREWYATQHNFKMGLLNQTSVSSDCWVVNALVKDKTGKVDPVALKLAVKKLSELAKYENASVHVSNLLVEEMPELKELVLTQVASNGTNCYFYNEPLSK